MEYRILFDGIAIAASSVVFLGAAMLLHGAFRSRSAAFRHLVLLGAFVGLLILPVLSLILPTWSLPDSPGIPARGPAGAVVTGTELGAVPAADLVTLARTESSEVRTAAGHPAESNSRAPFDRARWSSLGGRIAPHCAIFATALWALGAFAVIVVQIVRWAAAGFLAEMAVRIEDDSVRSLADRIRWELRIAKRVKLLRSDMAPVSMVWGIRRPCVLLPAEFTEWTPDKTEAVLRHELAHVKRNDNLFHLIAGLACAVYWFNPLVWTAMRLLHFEREVACDDCVLEAGTAASAYAKHLMEVSMKLSGPKSMRIVPAAMAHSSDVKRRLLHVLDPGMRRRPAGIGSMLGAIVLMFCIAVPVSAFRIWSDERPASPSQPAPPAEARGVEIVNAGDRGLWSIDGTIKIQKKSAAVDGTMENEAKHIKIKAAHVVFEPGLPYGFRFDSRRGSLVLTEARGKDKLVYEARPKGTGDDCEVSFALNGEAQALDADGMRDLKAIAEEIRETLEGNDLLGLSSLSSEGELFSSTSEEGPLFSAPDEKSLLLKDDYIVLSRGKDFMVGKPNSLDDLLDGEAPLSLDSLNTIFLRRGKGGDIAIVRILPDGKKVVVIDSAKVAISGDHARVIRLNRDSEKLAREYRRAQREIDRSSERADRDNQRAVEEATRAYREAESAEPMESVLELFQDQRESILDAMERLDGDAREEYRETVISSYEKMISGLDDKIESLETGDSAEPSAERKIELYRKLRDDMKATIAKLEKM